MQLYSHSEILHFQNIFVFFLGGGVPSDSLKEPKNLSPHYIPVKVLGHTNLPFVIPARLTALAYLQEGHIFRSVKASEMTDNFRVKYLFFLIL